MESQMEQIDNITKERKWKQITERDRYKIEALLASGMRPSDIARQIRMFKANNRKRAKNRTDRAIKTSKKKHI